MNTYSSLAIADLQQFVFGYAPHPVSLKNGLVIGGGSVYPELNFTLPDMLITPETMPAVLEHYSQMIHETTQRAVELNAPGLVIEFELLPDLTLVPQWGAEVTRILRETLDQVQQNHGLKTALRVTPNDIREFNRPPHTRSGKYVEAMLSSFELCAKAGADFLAIESTGGKELHDDAILNCDLPLSVFSLGILGARDMTWLWDQIVRIAGENGAIPSGDTACGFGNTAMVLAEQRFIPRVWAAVIRVMSVARSLVAFERGAQGPHKDCGYEGVYIKAITGCPIALEGAEAACAHFSQIGNIAKALPDLWSNESVQNTKLLAGMAPVVSVEQLIYATRVMNIATGHGAQAACTLRDWFVESDSANDPQAYVLRPDVVLELAAEIIAEPTAYLRTRRAAQVTLAKLRAANRTGEMLPLNKGELRHLERLSKLADELPADEDQFIADMLTRIDREKVVLGEYGL
ncbi:MAG: methyltransferase MtaB domain-containing protein [Anaerolineaceae bacterium]|nr:methyltransferase MtaB domain-containing protein [Anaerolineaceae bacterium]